MSVSVGVSLVCCKPLAFDALKSVRTSTFTIEAVIDLFHKGYKTAIKPFEFLTERSGVGCKGLIVRFVKNAVQTYQFRKKIRKIRGSCY